MASISTPPPGGYQPDRVPARETPDASGHSRAQPLWTRATAGGPRAVPAGESGSAERRSKGESKA